MLDHFGVDHRRKAASSEREPVAACLDQQAMARLEPPQFGSEDVQPDRVWQVLDDPAGSAADVQDALAVFQKAEDDPMSRPLPIPLQPNRTVKCSVIIIGRSDRVPQPPHTYQRLQERHTEFEEPHVGAAGATGHVVERHLQNLPSLGMHPNQEFFQ